jgi:hypothetical protein
MIANNRNNIGEWAVWTTERVVEFVEEVCTEEEPFHTPTGAQTI